MPEEEVISSVEETTALPAETEGESGTPEPEEVEETSLETSEELEPEKKSKGVQKRIDELVREREEWKRQAQDLTQIYQRQSHVTPEVKPTETVFPDLPKPRSDQFETYDDFIEAVADWKAETKIRQVRVEQQQVSQAQTLTNWHQKAREKYADWGEKFTNSVNISPVMGEVLLDSPNGIDLGYFLANNPAEATRIFQLPPARQAYELGKLENRMMQPKQKTTTNAPTPTSPVGGKEIPSKSPENMTYEEYKSWREGGGGK